MSDERATRKLDAPEVAWIARARDKANCLYEGRVTPHRSCGVALAETFGLPTRPYQALRRGGITGKGYCGAIRAGELVLGELLGDPSPTGKVTEELRAAMIWYQDAVPERIDRGKSPDYICNNLTAWHGDFSGDSRVRHCTQIAYQVAELTAEALIRFGPSERIEITPIPESSP